MPPDDGIESQPFPGTKWFQTEPNSPIVTAMGERLVTEECDRYSDGRGPQWTDADRESYQEWQRKLGFSGDEADGWPGATSWEQLRVPYVGQVPDEFEPFPGVEWFHTAPDSAIITAMGKRLVAEGCDEYEEGPGPQWTEADKRSYAVAAEARLQRRRRGRLAWSGLLGAAAGAEAVTKVRILLILLGACGGYGSWKLSQQARFYCGSYAGEQWFDAEPLLSVAAGIVLACSVSCACR